MHSPWFLFFLFIFALWLPFYTFCRAPALHPATPFEKGVDPKTFLRMATYFSWKGKEPGMPEPLISGNRSMDTVRRPLCGCFVLSCMVGGIFRKPLGFRRCLPPARPEKAKPFQAGRSPCTKHPQTVRLRLYALKKVFEGSKGRFFKNAPWQGVGQRPTKRGKACTTGHAFSGGTNTSIRKRGCKKILSEFFNIPFSMSSIYFFFFFLTAK